MTTPDTAASEDAQISSRDRVTLYFDAKSIREHYEGCDLDRQGVIDALSDSALQAAGEVIVNRLSDQFWESVDDLYSQVIDVAREVDSDT